MIANNLSTTCAYTHATAGRSSNALQAVRHGRQPTGGREASPGELVLQRLCRTRAGDSRSITPTPKDGPPYRNACRSIPTVVDAPSREVRQTPNTDEHQRSIWIRPVPVAPNDRLNLDKALLIPCASLLTVSRTI